MKKNRIIFMGTPEFSVKPLEALSQSEEIDVQLVITGKDKKRSRNKIESTPVKKKALELGLEVYEPDNVNSQESLELIDSINPDFIVVIAYGAMIKDHLLDTYKDRIINIHSSILPKYRGAAPMQWAILNKDDQTGVSSMLIEKSMDTGDVLDVRYMNLSPQTSIEEVHDKLSILASELIVTTILNYEDLYANRTKQNHDLATYSQKIDKEMGHIDFELEASDIQARIMAFSTWPSTYVFYKDKKIKIHQISQTDRINGHDNGQIIKVEKEGIFVNCQDKCIIIEKLQLEGKKSMDVASFILGNSLEIGEYLR